MDTETRYLPLEKAALVVIHAILRLPHYFQAHIVIVLIKHPLQALLRRSNFMGRIAKWGASLEAFGIQYKPQTSIMGQVLVDFIKEFTPKQPEVSRIGEGKKVEPWENVWQVYVDGASNCRGVGVGIILVSPKGIRVKKSFQLGFPTSNNEAKYEALFAGLRMSK